MGAMSPGPQLTIQVNQGDPIAIVVAGDIDIETSEILREAITEVLLAHEPAALIIDLKQVGFIDSSGLSVLLQTHQKLSSLEVRNPSPAVRMAVQATGLNQLLGDEQ
jgi:anti-sigma B factor antagonist